MANPAPKADSVDMAKAAMDLPLDAHWERQQVLNSLRALVHSSPADEAGRSGLLFAALYAGDRATALEQLAWLAPRQKALATPVLERLVALLVMLGDMERAAEVLDTLLGRHDALGTDKAATEMVLWALLAGRTDLARALESRLTGETPICTLVSREGFTDLLAIFAITVAETIGQAACTAEVALHADSPAEQVTVYYALRVPGDRAVRWQRLRKFRALWRERLAARGLHEVEWIGVLTADVLPMPAEADAAA